MRLKRLFADVVGGAWGDDSGEGQVDVWVVRATDFDYGSLRVSRQELPRRGVSHADIARKRLVDGDLIIEKSGGGEKQPVGRVVLFDLDTPSVPSNFAARLRPIRLANPRFLSYLMASLYTEGVTRSHVRQTTGIQNLDLNGFLNERVEIANLSAQRVIADFLDTETARIDAVVSRKSKLVRSLKERLMAARESVIWGSVAKRAPLMRLVDPDRKIMYGIVLPGPNVDEGIPIVKGGDVRHLGDANKLCRTTREIEAGYHRSRLKAGDLVFAIRGGIGDVAEVPDDVEGANITQDVARVSPALGVERRWLLHVLQSQGFQGQAAASVTGATVKGLNIWDLDRLMVPFVPLREQQQAAEELGEIEMTVSAAVALLAHQIALLGEHRQALITAAVTGQLEVPGAA